MSKRFTYQTKLNGIKLERPCLKCFISIENIWRKVSYYKNKCDECTKKYIHNENLGNINLAFKL